MFIRILQRDGSRDDIIVFDTETGINYHFRVIDDTTVRCRITVSEDHIIEFDDTAAAITAWVQLKNITAKRRDLDTRDWMENIRRDKLASIAI